MTFLAYTQLVYAGVSQAFWHIVNALTSLQQLLLTRELATTGNRRGVDEQTGRK